MCEYPPPLQPTWREETTRRLERIERQLHALLKFLPAMLAKESKDMSLLDDKISALKTAVENETTVEQSAISLINGIPGLIADAVAKAIAAGATADELQALTDLSTSITSSSGTLSAAVVANTPAAPPPADTTNAGTGSDTHAA